jgi:hypothetical protein
MNKYRLETYSMNGPWSRRLLLIVLVTLLTLTSFTSALAAKPEFLTIPVDVTFAVGGCDGFTVMQHVEGTVKLSTHFNNDGNVVMEIARVRLRHTFSNSETGYSLITPDVGIDKLTVHQDGSILAVSGLVFRIVVPGEGLVWAFLGTLVFDVNSGELIFEAGQHDDFAELLPVLCSALG